MTKVVKLEAEEKGTKAKEALRQAYQRVMEEADDLEAFVLLTFYKKPEEPLRGNHETTLSWHTNLWPAPLFAEIAAAQIKSRILTDITLSLLAPSEETPPDAS